VGPRSRQEGLQLAMACCHFCNSAPSHETLLKAPAMQVMAGVEQIDVQERVSGFEALTALAGHEIEMANRYKIKDHKTGKDIFYAVEKTGLCRRQLQVFFGDCAPWEVDILYTEGTRRDLAFKLERPWKCSCCCFNRPTVTVREYESGRLLGSLRDPVKCCTAMKFQLMDYSGNRVATASSGCVQCGLCCSCPCGPCSRIHLAVRDRSGKKVGRMYRQIPGCCKWMLVPDADNYFVEFDKDMDPVDKVLLMSLAIFMDFRYFNNNVLDSKRGPNGSDPYDNSI